MFKCLEPEVCEKIIKICSSSPETYNNYIESWMAIPNGEDKPIIIDESNDRMYRQMKDRSFYFKHYNDHVNALIPDSLYDLVGLDKKNPDIQVLRYSPATFAPPHIDKYRNITSKYGSGKYNRLIVFLSDPNPHHIFMRLNEMWNCIPKGYGTMIGDDQHAAINISTVNRWVLALTSKDLR